MTTKYNISVVIPIYNSEKYIARCIESILQQNYCNYEIILVDDESSDKSRQICDYYAQKYDFIKTMYLNNGGPARARRIGVEHSSGKYVMFVDSDDYIAEDMMQKLCDCSEDADIVCSNYYKVAGTRIKEQPTYKQDKVYYSSPIDVLYDFFTRCCLNGSLWGKIIKRTLFNDIDFCEGAIIGEDINVMLQLYERANEVRYISESLYYYVQNLEGISHSGYTEKHRVGLEYYIMTRQNLIKRYPKLKIPVTGFFLEYEMATITSMCRNRQYDTEVIKMLQKDLKNNLWLMLKNKYTALYMKISALMIIMCPSVFIFLFRVIHIITGR